MFVYLFTLLGCPQGTDTDVKPGDSEEDNDTAHTAEVPTDADEDGYPVEVDCDDTDPAINSGADEVCDQVDNDCDGLVDDEDVDEDIGYIWFTDADHDGFGVDGTERVACDPESNEVSFGGDCDDGDNMVFPGAQELCDGVVDEDCDGLVDDADPDAATGEFWFQDLDGDGYGAGDGAGGCDQPEGTVTIDGDCDDTNAAISPLGTELCDPDNLDEDCDGGADDDDPNGTPEGNFPWFRDEDGDGYGVDDDQIFTCDGGDGYAGERGDCEPDDPSISPGADDVCDGIDQDCDGVVDNGSEAWYPDADRDGFGEVGAPPSCEASDRVADNTDCNDGDPAVNPAASEVCNGADDDCDGALDAGDDSLAGDVIYLDNDGDTYGDDSTAFSGCAGAPPLTLLGGDCDDADAAISPGATERFGDEVDDDCDGATTPTWASCVGTAVPADFTSIRDAVSAVEAAGGGTVCVASGTYVEDVDLGLLAAVTLVGEDPEATVIEGVVTVYAERGALSQLGVVGGLRLSEDEAISSTVTLADLRLEGVGGPGLWVLFETGGQLDLDMQRVSLTADGSSAGMQIYASTCDVGTDPALLLSSSGLWVHDASYGVEIQNAGETCSLAVDLGWSTFTGNTTAVRAEVSAGMLSLGLAYSLLVDNTTAVSWETLFGGGSITGAVTYSMFYGNTQDYEDNAFAGVGYVWGTDPLLDDSFAPPVPGTPAQNAFPAATRSDYWGVACLGVGCDYGAVEGG